MTSGIWMLIVPLYFYACPLQMRQECSFSYKSNTRISRKPEYGNKNRPFQKLLRATAKSFCLKKNKYLPPY